MDTKSDSSGEQVGHVLTPSANSENTAGCGENDGEKITITVAPTTGGTFDISVQKDIAIESLKKVISKKLKVPKERILLLHKERQLRDGSLMQNNVCEGSTVTLVPSVETGLLSQRPEQTVMQALESLNDSQVNDFLSGKAPLNLTMRLGDHMMLIQLQLSSVTPSSSRKSRAHETLPQVPTPTTAPSDTPTTTPTPDPADISLPNLSLINSKLNSLLHKNHENLNALKRKLINDPEAGKKKQKPEEKDCQDNSQAGSSRKSTKYIDIIKDTVAGQAGSEVPNKRSEILSQIMESVRRISENTQEMTQAIEGKSCEGNRSARCETSCTCAEVSPSPSTSTVTQRESETTIDPTTGLDTKALAEASRNLTQTLKQLSSEVLTCRPESAPESTPGPSTSSRRRPGTPGAIIESMQHHGKGVFSGTFSGTLNPALQDRFGRPKRDISTIIHILNDLLCATPHYRPKSSSSTKSSSGQSSKKSAQAAAVPLAEEEETTNENEATRGKMERLRMVMEQNRARRQARRQGHDWSDQHPELEAAEDMDTTEAGEMLEISPLEPVIA